MKNIVIGLDLDNTLVDYSMAVKKYSTKYLEKELEDIDEIRDFFRQSRNDLGWQKAQSWIYTSGMKYASVAPGTKEMFAEFSRLGLPFFAVSHKTSRTPMESGFLDLRGPAEHWIRENLELIGLELSMIFFEVSRQAKIRRIMLLELSHFVDDLLEVLTDESFPRNIKRYLYDPYHKKHKWIQNVEVISSLDQICKLL